MTGLRVFERVVEREENKLKKIDEGRNWREILIDSWIKIRSVFVLQNIRRQSY